MKADHCFVCGVSEKDKAEGLHLNRLVDLRR